MRRVAPTGVTFSPKSERAYVLQVRVRRSPLVGGFIATNLFFSSDIVGRILPLNGQLSTGSCLLALQAFVHSGRIPIGHSLQYGQDMRAHRQTFPTFLFVLVCSLGRSSLLNSIHAF